MFFKKNLLINLIFYLSISASMKKQKAIPFEFVIEKLDRLSPVIKPMFGCHAIYIENKIMAILRRKEKSDPDNGMWLATTSDHHHSLLEDLPSMRSIKIFGDRSSGWQILPEDADDFEESVSRACDFILKRDPRIGKIPDAKRKKRA
jgi:hypothetical protein